VERETNQGSLGSIDALLGCPLYLPKHQLMFEEPWKSLTRRQKELSCYGLFYSINWIRELINAFATQIEARVDDSSAQLTKEETTTKLFQRLRNLIIVVKA
jgi:Fanconi anemia group D2 protein